MQGGGKGDRGKGGMDKEGVRRIEGTGASGARDRLSWLDEEIGDELIFIS